MVGAVLGLFVRPLQRNEANLYDVYTPPPGRGGGGAAAGRQRGGGRESQHVGASTAHGRRSGTRCRGKATVHPATGRAITRASACDVRTAQQTRAPRAGSSSSKPAATRCLLAPDLIRGSLPVSPRTPLLPAVSQDRYRGQSWMRPRPRLAALMQAAGARGQLHRPRHLTCAPELTSHLPYNPISGLGARLQAQVDVPSAIHRHFPCARLAALMQLGVCGSGPGAFGSGFDLIRARIRVSTPVSGPWGAPFELLYAHGAYCAKCYIKQGLPMRFSPAVVLDRKSVV